MCELILASGSSRRRSLLKQLNLDYRVVVPNVDETVGTEELATDYVARISKAKAINVFDLVSNNLPVLAADTIISFDGDIIGKPKDAKHAKNILLKLSAVEHEVLTGLYLIAQGCCYEKIVVTKVKFKQLTNSQIDAYCLTDEPYDKAGAYAIQGLAATFVEHIYGSYTNVMGLPLSEVCSLLKQANLYKFGHV